MPFPTQDFETITAWLNWVDTNYIPNGIGSITGDDGNITEHAAAKFISQSPLNWKGATIFSGGGSVSVSDPVNIFMSNTPTSLSWADNIYNEYIFINMTSLPIPLLTGFVYYKPDGTVSSSVPAASAVNILKASNNLWVQGNTSSSGSGGSVQKQPLSFKVGTDVGAPVAGTNTWTLPIFLNSWVMLSLNRVSVDLKDMGDGSPFVVKGLTSDTLTIGNYSTGWNNGDILTYTLITP